MGGESSAHTSIKMPEKQLELSKRNAFFKDPFFRDMVGGMGDGLEKRLAEFSARSMGVSIGGGMGGMPSLGMDDMMGKMMSNMGSMNMNSSSSKMSSSSFSSSSSSSMMSSDMSSMMGGMTPMRGMQMPGFDMPGLSFQEMPSMPASAAPSVAAPEYTVTSPPMSPPPPEMSHKVQKTEDYVPPTTQTAEATVLLKVKEGNEYKLALNMQQYSPEDI